MIFLRASRAEKSNLFMKEFVEDEKSLCCYDLVDYSPPSPDTIYQPIEKKNDTIRQRLGGKGNSSVCKDQIYPM
jgi:hypothetical protein